MSRASIILLILFSIVFFIALMMSATNPGHIAQFELTGLWLRQAMGSFLAIAASLTILVRALNGKRCDELITFVVALLAALAVVTAAWSLTLSLAAIVIVVVVKELLSVLLAKSE